MDYLKGMEMIATADRIAKAAAKAVVIIIGSMLLFIGLLLW